MEDILQQLVNGFTLAAIYALIAVGVSLFFGVIGIVNLAHGDVAAFAAFSAIAAQKMALPYLGPTGAALLSIPVGVGVGALLGWGLYRFAFRPLGDAPPVIGLLAAIAAGFIIREFIFNFFDGGRNPQPFPSILPNTVYDVAGVFVMLKQLVVIATAIGVVVWLAALIQRSDFGRAIRSLASNREATQTLGVPVDRTLAVTFLVGGGLAGIAGVLNGVYYGLVQFDMGMQLTVKGFVAAVIGGLGNVYGALVGALIVGLLEAFTAGLVPKGSAYKDVVVFGALILILLLRPEGIVRTLRAKKV